MKRIYDKLTRLPDDPRRLFALLIILIILLLAMHFGTSPDRWIRL